MWSQTLFFLLFGPWYERGESRWNLMLKREFLFESISTTKIIKIWIKLFVLMRETHIRIFYFYFEIAKKNIYNLSKIFSLWMISGFGMIFGFFKVKNEFIKLPRRFGYKWVENWVFGLKKLSALFFQPP